MCHKTALWWFIAVLQRRLGPQILFSRWYRSQQTPQNCDFQRFLGENENYDAKTTFPLIISYITIFICVVKVIADSFLSLHSVLYYMINVVAGAGLVSRLLLSLHRCLTPLCSQPGLSVVHLCHCELLFSLSLSPSSSLVTAAQLLQYWSENTQQSSLLFWLIFFFVSEAKWFCTSYCISLTCWTGNYMWAPKVLAAVTMYEAFFVNHVRQLLVGLLVCV